MELEKQGVKMIHVKQGYAKCSVCIVDENAIITSDRGIAKVAKNTGFEVMVIEPGFIQLRGLNYGFIGGATGLLDKDALGFAGDLTAHKNGLIIKDFLWTKGKTCIGLGELSLSDVGSIIPLKEYNPIVKG